MKLIYNEEADRYNDFYCGECFRIKVNNKWKEVRIEYSTRRYLIDAYNFTCSRKALEDSR